MDSLYNEGRTLVVGSGMAVGAILLTFARTGEPALLLCAAAFALVAAIRGLVMRAYFNRRGMLRSAAAARHWEQLYVAGAASSVALLGIWCFVALATTPDAFAHLVSFSITIAYVVGISGRNFGSGRLVMLQILCAWAPMTAALILYGSVYHWVFASLLVPFFMGLKFISDRLRRTLLDAVVATGEISELARRFDTALNNMPHGLCMFDAAGRVVVSNARLNRLFDLPPSLEIKGTTARRIAQHCVAEGALSNLDAERFTREFEERLARSTLNDLYISVRGGRTLSLTFEPMDNGGTVVLVEDITERQIAEARINHLARFDALTGLPNRTFFRDRMDEVLAGHDQVSSYAIHFVDLDRFKQVNDTLGHPLGDVLLQTVADRLRAIVRETDVITRFGGDEFVVVQTPVKRLDEASALAQRIVSELGRPYRIEGHEIVIGASIGIALSPRDGADVDQLLKNADMALYQAKSDDRGTWRFFEAGMDISAQARRTLELDLRNALETDAFELHYQPLIDLRSGRIAACEALLRWPHPRRGMVSPAEFIPVAEEMGLILDIGRQVLRKACMECRSWPGDMRVAVNLSPIQFSRGDITAVIRETLAATGLPAHRLEIEITETILLQDTRATRTALQQLEELGVCISLDDFGTGYSSLSYLHSFPLHKVKIDRSFLLGLAASPRKLTLLRGIARLSAELGLRVTVEGVETEQQLELISAEGNVDEAQGYFFSRPVPSSELARVLYSLPERAGQVA